ncbi:sensor domain-containing diguanylate cyclase [Criibacterium bergeronii]|uniref:sensor domain-containing diguanylate cyclase n=1 Tax=Criibacterium bergeronii TaxID=1871336 RepID=UPI000A6E0477|nr:sensor domain-containing diguanylate cyclase [Criibacterium bergeronii]MBS6062359.1 GGDEF domain-containing protein [Peptostreptococcaceae bacterium]
MAVNDFYNSILENLYEGIYFVDVDRTITFWNKGAELITGFYSDEIIGKHCNDNILNHVDENGNKLCLSGCPLHKSLMDGEERNAVVFLHHKDGHRVKIHTNITPLVENGKIIGGIEVFREISENKPLMMEEKESYSEEELKVIALHDQLTGIPNRRYAESFLNAKINEYKDLGIALGVIFGDIDNFGNFNNTYGHELGDKVLKTVSNTMLNAIRKNDLIGRWGGEEFLVILPAIDYDELEKNAEKIRMLVENSILRENGAELHITISLGATMIKKEDYLQSLVKRADDLMYESKKSGKNRVTMG